MPRLSVQRLFDERRERLGLAWAGGRAGAEREFSGEMLRKPGVGLIDKLDRQVLKHKERFAPRHAPGIKRIPQSEV